MVVGRICRDGMSSLPADDREDELNDEDIPTVVIPGFDPETGLGVTVGNHGTSTL